jgi:hypothetical protein
MNREEESDLFVYTAHNLSLWLSLHPNLAIRLFPLDSLTCALLGILLYVSSI